MTGVVERQRAVNLPTHTHTYTERKRRAAFTKSKPRETQGKGTRIKHKLISCVGQSEGVFHVLQDARSALA